VSEYTLAPCPCPFCGGAAELLALGQLALVRCDSCGASTDEMWEWRQTPGSPSLIDRAVAAWNMRTHNAHATFAGKAQSFISTKDVPEDS